MSDFLPGANAGESAQIELFRLLGLTNRRHDLSCILLSDPRELELPEVGWLTLEDAETGEQVEVNTRKASSRERYHKANVRRVEDLEKQLLQAGIDFVHASTDRPYLHALKMYFKARSKRR